MNLKNLLSNIKTDFKIIKGQEMLESLDINDLAIDSRKIISNQNTIFFALNGEKKKGVEFAKSAIDMGAKVIICDQDIDYNNVIIIKTNTVFKILVEFLYNFYNRLPANIYAVTGTNGKTSTAEFIRQIINFLGKKSASIGTLGINCDEAIKPMLISFDLTTPDIVSLYKNLYILKQNNVDDVAIEVSSIGLKQARIAGLNISVAGFTNFSQDHLDYHKTMDEYFYCKMLLFEAVMPDGSPVVLNADIAEFAKIKRMCIAKKHHILEYGFKAQDLKLLKISVQGASQLVLFECAGQQYQIKLNISGDFQVYNMLCALGMVMAKHVLYPEKLQNLLQQFNDLKTALGRMQLVSALDNKAQIFIDFAHTPDALENMLQLGRNLVTKQRKGRLLVLFGCGGDRDNKKRPLMGQIASRLADIVIVTDDNPRTEDAAIIRSQILSACNSKNCYEIADRKIAIANALKMLQPYDILILAGKGHEKYQIIGTKKTDFDEEKIVHQFIQN